MYFSIYEYHYFMKKLFLLLIAICAISLGMNGQRIVRGQVTDPSGEPLIGATVQSIGGGKGAITDIDGKFSMNLPYNVKTLKVSYVGYKTKEINVDMKQNVYDFTVKDRRGNDVSLNEYKGKVLLIVNTATRCGFTPQYEELEALYKNYKDKGLEILDFPCNQFGEQAPGTEEEIHQFCTLNFGTEFPQFKKIEVNGENELPLYTFLKSQKGFKGFDLEHKIGKLLDEMLSKADPKYASKPDIKWNFTKFLIDREGNVVERYEPTTDTKVIEEAINQLL